MSNNDRSSGQRFLPHAIQAFLWGRAREQSSNAMDNQHESTSEQASLNPAEAVPPPTHLPTHSGFDAHSDSSMPDLLSDGWSDSDSSQDARDVEMDIVPDDHDDNWVDEDDEMSPFRSTASVEQLLATDRRARVEEDVEPPPSQPHRIPNPAPPPRLHPGAVPSQPFPTLPPWNFGLGTARTPGRLFPLFPNPAASSGNSINGNIHRDDIPTNLHPQPTQPPHPERNPIPANAQQDTRGPQFHAHTFVLGMDGSGRAVPIPPGAFSALLNQFGAAIPQPQAQTPQPDQPGENRDQPRQPGDANQPPPFVDFVVGGIGPIPPFFTNPGTGQQPPDDTGNAGGPEPGRGAPAWAELLRAMLGGEPPEEKEDPERAKKLVEGLERVSEGLVKRMTRVDDIPGAHEESTDGGTPGCAICWDSLLPEGPSGDIELQYDGITPSKSEHPSEGSDARPAVSDPAPDDDTSTAVICLPCSHVFHASCLIPWFSKPKHTTCPTCRFDIDPRNLTYTPPRRPRTAPTTTTTGTTPANNPPQPGPNPTTTSANPPPAPQNGGQPPPLDPLRDGERGHAAPPVFISDFFPGPPQQGPDRLPGESQNIPPDNRHEIPPQVFGFEFGPQLPPIFGPPPPPGHPTHGAHPDATNVPRDHGHGPHPEAPPFADFSHGGIGHAHLQGPGIAVDFTLHVPPEQGLDAERISQAVRDQAAAFLRFFAGGGGGPGTGQPMGQTPTPGVGGTNREPEAPREWMPPPAPGPTLRQRVETKERKAGLRCDDPSCGIGPSDEDPFPEAFNDPSSSSIKRFPILNDAGEEAVCGHVFHPSCLVSADRCAGWGEKDRSSQDGDEEYEVVSCPVCRNVGKVQIEVWKEGAKELLV